MTPNTHPCRQDFRFSHRLRVRWVEVDMQKIVFNAHYLMYFDTAISDYWRALALPYEASMQQLGGELYVKKASVEYHGSARFDDQLAVALRCSRIGHSSVVFTGAIFRGDTLLVSGELVYVFADPLLQTSQRVPDALRALLDDFEAGKSVVHFKTGDWAAVGADASAVRGSVFVQEQGIAADKVWDTADATALHVVACNGLGQSVAAGRLVQAGSSVSTLGRMAVVAVLRGAGLGHQLLDALIQAARQRGDTQLQLHAQCSAEGFYRRAGFTPEGAPFDEVGITHIRMVKQL